MATRETPRIQVIQGDITSLHVDAIVTSANNALVGGGGVDGAVHKAAGPGLFDECRALNYCPDGEARITRGHGLPARFILHTVAPVWGGGYHGEAQLLEACYRCCLELALQHSIESLAFPCLGTGVYLFPKELACEIAFATVTAWLQAMESPKELLFCCFEDEDLQLYQQKLLAPEIAALV